MIKRLQALKAKKGFTLVELIVVIAIIGVLAAILIPLLVNHVQNSRCTREAADAKSAHNVAIAVAADGISRGDAVDTIIAAAEAAAEDEVAEVDIEWNDAGDPAEGLVAIVGDHAFPAEESDCEREGCPVVDNRS
jgi:prepilin-type N-terminal cleavage/methylation domain-containing protein